ncbi:hypothetical protein WDU94_000728 [Cyamophila willieti]
MKLILLFACLCVSLVHCGTVGSYNNYGTAPPASTSWLDQLYNDLLSALSSFRAPRRWDQGNNGNNGRVNKGNLQDAVINGNGGFKDSFNNLDGENQNFQGATINAGPNSGKRNVKPNSDGRKAVGVTNVDNAKIKGKKSKNLGNGNGAVINGNFSILSNFNIAINHCTISITKSFSIIVDYYTLGNFLSVYCGITEVYSSNKIAYNIPTVIDNFTSVAVWFHISLPTISTRIDDCALEILVISALIVETITNSIFTTSDDSTFEIDFILGIAILIRFIISHR